MNDATVFSPGRVAHRIEGHLAAAGVNLSNPKSPSPNAPVRMGYPYSSVTPPSEASLLQQTLCAFAQRRILVTGPSGAGKTHLASAFMEWGINAHDADTIDALTGWFDMKGCTVQYPLDADKLFLDTHTFLWSRTRLTAFLGQQASVFLFGISRNIFSMTDLFDTVVFLTVPPSVLADRLRNPNRRNPMGRTDYQLEYSLSWAERNEATAKQRGFPMIDGTLTPEDILAKIAKVPTR